MPIFNDDYHKQFGPLDVCPCCGAPAEWRGGSSTPDYIKCSKCNLKYTGGSNRQKLADGWNTRTEQTCHFKCKKHLVLYDIYECDKCGFEVSIPLSEGGIDWRYCPNCKAKVVQE